jgi:hypothetical protein
LNEVDSTNFTEFNFFINSSDVIFTLNCSKDLTKDKINNLIGKIIIIREDQKIDLFEVAKLLDLMGINKLNIITIYPNDTLEKVNYIKIKEPSTIKYLEINARDFLYYLNNPSYNFLEHNKNSLYVLKEGSYLDIKNIFTKINGFDTNVGRGGSQKSHVISPIDFRLSCYLMAMFKFDYKHITYLNAFNVMDKERYLPYIGRS